MEKTGKWYGLEFRAEAGLERFVKAAMERFDAMRIQSTIYRAGVSIWTKKAAARNGFYGANPNPQYLHDHKNDLALFLDDGWAKKYEEVLTETLEAHKEEADGFAGPVCVETFGMPGFAPVKKPEASDYTREQNKKKQEMDARIGEITNQYMNGENRSFTIVNYPCPAIGEQFDEIFDAVIRMNVLDADRYEKVQQIIIDAPDAEYEMTELAGAWGRERHVKTQPLHVGIQSIYSLRGHSSHMFNPFLMLKRPGTDENSGEVFGVSLIYSGNFLGQVEVDNYHVTRVMMGIHPEGFTWNLTDGTEFQIPEAVMVYSADGMNAMSQAFHRLYRTRLARGYWRDRTRPVLINNWEATYMKFNEEKLVGIAKKAKELGIELFVLDDGWFGHRDDDTTSLGDWFADQKKLPNGIEGVAEKITSLGMRFGLWFEPEMISKDSELYRAHPDYMLQTPGRVPCHGRNQYVLDFSREEVVNYVAESMEKILKSGKVSYIKWDMNRSITDGYSSAADADVQGEVLHRQILGVYALYERLTREFPEVLFESCASGGGRFDPGMLYYAPQGWTSDDTDAAERLKVQYGTSYCYPVSAMGSHVSAVPNHQVFRKTPMKTRADVAYFGTFGYELDVNKLPEEEQEQIKEQIAFRKEYEKLIREGTFYRLISPFASEDEETAWMVVSEDKKQALVGYYRMRQPVNEGYRWLKLAGLDADKAYKVKDTAYKMAAEAYTYYGDELMEKGFDISDSGFGPWTPWIYQGDYQSRLFLVEEI